MKRFLLCLPMFLLFFVFPDTCFALDMRDRPSDFGPEDYPSVYASPSGYGSYVCQYIDGVEWNLYYVDDISGVNVTSFVYGSSNVYSVHFPIGVSVDKFTAKIKKDNAYQMYYVEDWVLEREGIPLNSSFSMYYDWRYGGRDYSVPFYNFDLYTDGGHFFIDSNPFPVPPLASIPDYHQLSQVLTGVWTVVLPVGLGILGILFLFGLIRWFLQYVTFRNQ